MFKLVVNVGVDFVVPFAVEFVADNLDFGQLRVVDFDFVGVVFCIQPGVDFEAGFRASAGDQVDDNLQSLQRNALPIAGDVAEQAMFDLVPFARARWIVTDFDDQARGIGEPLQFQSPESGARTVAPAAVGRRGPSLRCRASRR